MQAWSILEADMPASHNAKDNACHAISSRLSCAVSPIISWNAIVEEQSYTTALSTPMLVHKQTACTMSYHTFHSCNLMQTRVSCTISFT